MCRKELGGLPNIAMVVGLRAAANFARLSSCTLPMAVCHSVAGRREFWKKNGVSGEVDSGAGACWWHFSRNATCREFAAACEEAVSQFAPCYARRDYRQ
jgi:hypothetical protein